MTQYNVQRDSGPEELAISKEPGSMVVINKTARNPLEDAIRRLRKKLEMSGKLEDYRRNQYFRTKKEKRLGILK